MHSMGSIMRHWRLVSGMAKATDTDLVRAYQDGSLSAETWSQMVTSCRGCDWADGCVGWLDTHESADQPPHSCPNRARFAVLRAVQKGETA